MNGHIVMNASNILDCEDFSYSEGNGIFRFFDHAEGVQIVVTSSEFISAIADGLADEAGEEVDEYYTQLAANIFAHSCKSGRAQFLFNMLP